MAFGDELFDPYTPRTTATTLRAAARRSRREEKEIQEKKRISFSISKEISFSSLKDARELENTPFSFSSLKVIEEKERIYFLISKEISFSSSKDNEKEISFSSSKFIEEKDYLLVLRGEGYPVRGHRGEGEGDQAAGGLAWDAGKTRTSSGSCNMRWRRRS